MPPQLCENIPSSSLSKEENEQLFALLGGRCQTLATCVVQLYGTEPSNPSRWIKQHAGVLCFVKDNNQKNFFFRLYCLKRNTLIWEQEMHNNMKYSNASETLHTFERDGYRMSFSFTSIMEAKELKAVVDRKLLAKERREESSRINVTRPTNNDAVMYREKIANSAAKKRTPKRNINRLDIGKPSHFKHVAHYGWDPDKGFNPNCDDPQLSKFFQMAGVPEKLLKNRNSREFIYDLINEHGGREAVQKELQKTRRPTHRSPMTGRLVPAQKHITKADIGNPCEFRHVTHYGWDADKGFDVSCDDPQLKKIFQKKEEASEKHLQDKNGIDPNSGCIKKSNLQPAVQKEGQKKTGKPNRGAVRPPRTAPPPPPGVSPPPPPGVAPPAAGLAPPPPGIAAPPPPPPPPPAPLLQPRAPTELHSSPAIPKEVVDAPVPDGRSALMESIRGGAKLKPVKSEGEVMVTSAPDGRSALMESIRGGAKLKPMKVEEEVMVTSAPDGRSALMENIREEAKLKPVKIEGEVMVTSAPDGRSALMESIRGGAKLKPVNIEREVVVAPAPDGRSALMESIREGAKLKPVNIERNPTRDKSPSAFCKEISEGFELKPAAEREEKPVSAPSEKEGLTGILIKALEERYPRMHSDEDSTSGTDTKDEEWDA